MATAQNSRQKYVLAQITGPRLAAQIPLKQRWRSRNQTVPIDSCGGSGYPGRWQGEGSVVNPPLSYEHVRARASDTAVLRPIIASSLSHHSSTADKLRKTRRFQAQPSPTEGTTLNPDAQVGFH